MMTMDSLSPEQRRKLKAQAHGLKPVVMVSDQGLSDAVVREIERGLNSHGLIKIRVMGHERPEREELLAQVCSKTYSHAVQHIGKMLVIYREPQEPAPQSRPDAPIRRKAATGQRHVPVKRAGSRTRARS